MVWISRKLEAVITFIITIAVRLVLSLVSAVIGEDKIDN